MKIIAHIGHGKTGTSSIQKTLAVSQKALNSVGSYYVGLNFEFSPVKIYPWQVAGGWLDLEKNGLAIAKQQLTEVITKTINILENNGIRQVIWSNESILSRFNIVGPVLQSLRIAGRPVEIILYLRRHDAWARSAYLQWGIKHKAYEGKVQSFSKWLERNPINFSRPVKPWLDHQWDNIYVRNFAACDDVVKDFLHCCAIPDGLIESQRENESPETVALALWAIFNSQKEEPILPYDLQPLLQRSNVTNKRYKYIDLSELFPTPENMNHVMETVQNDVAHINNILCAFNQPPFDNEPIKEKDYDISYEQIFAALLDITRFQDSENIRQDEEIRKLKRRMMLLEKKLSELGH